MPEARLQRTRDAYPRLDVRLADLFKKPRTVAQGRVWHALLRMMDPVDVDAWTVRDALPFLQRPDAEWVVATNVGPQTMRLIRDMFRPYMKQ